MSLNWDLTDIHDSDNVCWIKNESGYDVLHPRTESLIWLSMVIGMGTITEDNAAEFYSRVALYEKMFEVFCCRYEDGSRVEIPVSVEDIHAHIGLRTNVSYEKPHVFANHITKIFFSDNKEKYSNRVANLQKEG